MNEWLTHCYTRLLIDNHISEDDPAAMTRFDPQRYVELVKKAGVEAAMVYACDHNGNCYYPTHVGHMHRNLNGRDIFGQTVSELRRQGIYPIAYYTSIYHNHSARTHPGWRIESPDGAQHSGRYWWSCPNNDEYVDYTRAQVLEVIDYDVDGIFIDMTFWPVICCCANCREKFLAQTGLEIPEKIDWNDPAWRAFQGFREQSMTDFCNTLTRAIKAYKDITVTYQNSLIMTGWMMGQMPGVADACDYTSGDFYEGKYQQILGTKVLSAASKYQPFEFMTPRCVNLGDHTSLKSEAELRCEAATTLASAGAYFYIDAINPDGTLMDTVYERLGKVTAAMAPFTEQIRRHRPVLRADTGLYFSMASLINPAMNGKPLREGQHVHPPVYEEMLGTSIVLTRNHRMFKAVRDAEGDLSELQTLIINNAVCMSDEEIEKVRQFVRAGGTLIATGGASLLYPDRSPRADFGLADVFGLKYGGGVSRRVNYLRLPQGDLQCNRAATLATLAGADLLAGLVEPLFDPDDPQQYASIHSNPPGRSTPFVGLSANTYGRGRCIYVASSVLAMQQDAQQQFGAWLLQQYAAPGLVPATNAPGAVEITVLRSTAQPAYLVSLVNYQKELPNIPLRDIQVEAALPGLTPQTCRLVSSGAPLAFTLKDGRLQFTLPELETMEMVEVTGK